MHRSYLFNCLCLSLLFFGVPVATRAEFTPITGWDQHLFPSYIIATASLRGVKEHASAEHLGDPRGLLGAAVVAPLEGASVKVTVECPEFFETSVFHGTLPEQGKKYLIYPTIKYRYDRLAQQNQVTSASVTFRVQIANEQPEEQTVPLTIRSINDCPFAVVNHNHETDVSFTFAAYVNEQHPFVDKLLREALDRGVVENFTGYQSGNEKEVILQAYALWDVLVARDIRYSNITTTAGDSRSVHSQHVRLLEDSVNNGQANCVDGSVLWVSLMRKIGIDAFLVLEPTHCYAGFFADREQKVAYAIETTLLGAAIDENDTELAERFDNMIDESLRDERSYPSFVGAVETASTKLLRHFQEEKSPTEKGVKLIDIASARREGVLPIPFQNQQEFQEFNFADDSWDKEESTEESEDETSETEENDER